MRDIGSWELDSIPYEGRCFEYYMLGEDCSNSPLGIDKSNFTRALFKSAETQRVELGFPNKPIPNISIVLNEVVSEMPDKERGLVKVFSTIGRPADIHKVDCFFYYRGCISTVDLTLRYKENGRPFQVILRDDILGSDKVLKKKAEEIRNILKKGLFELNCRQFAEFYKILKMYESG